jgi:hypothetical protein
MASDANMVCEVMPTGRGGTGLLSACKQAADVEMASDANMVCSSSNGTCEVIQPTGRVKSCQQKGSGTAYKQALSKVEPVWIFQNIVNR